MPANLPLTVLIEQLIRHTPIGVWIVLAAVTLLGLRQMRGYQVSRVRLMLMPIVLGALSLWSITAAFGANAAILIVWMAGLGIALALNRAIRSPREARLLSNGNFALHGSIVPLLAMLTVFMLRYVVTVTLMLHHDWKGNLAFSLSMALAYGALAGLFAARALRVLRSAPAEPALGIA